MAFEIVEDLGAWTRDNESPIITFDFGGFHGADFPEEWDYEPEPEESFDADYVIKRQGELYDVSPSTFVEFAVRLR